MKEGNLGEAVMSLGDDLSGYAVFEFTSFDAEVQFKVLAENGVDDPASADVDESTVLNWGDTEVSGGDNVVVDLSSGGTIRVFIDEDDMVAINPQDSYATDKTMYTYTSTAACAVEENLLTVFVKTDLDHTLLGLVGSVQGWSPSTAISAVGETASGLVVF